MPSSTTSLVILVLFNAALIGVLVYRPSITYTRGGKILAFLALFFLPVLCGSMGVSNQMERAKQTEFCLSCHTMQAFGKSLYIDDPGHLPAAHFQNHRVTADEACYTCHTNYAMFGPLKVKLSGLRHVYIYYLGTPPAPGSIKLYEPYNNRECLHCHQGARSFEEGATHNADPATLPAVKVKKLSCLSSGCHEVVHDIERLEDAKLWKGK